MWPTSSCYLGESYIIMDSKRNSFFLYENELEEEGGMVFCLGFLVETTGEVDSLVRRN